MSDLNILEPSSRSCLRESFHKRQQSMLSCLVSLLVQKSREAVPGPAILKNSDAVPKTKTLRGRLADVDRKYQSVLDTAR